jgi:hypothetical protein
MLAAVGTVPGTETLVGTISSFEPLRAIPVAEFGCGVSGRVSGMLGRARMQTPLLELFLGGSSSKSWERAASLGRGLAAPREFTSQAAVSHSIGVLVTETEVIMSSPSLRHTCSPGVIAATGASSPYKSPSTHSTDWPRSTMSCACSSLTRHLCRKRAGSEHASGCPKLRSASANPPLGSRWPAISALIVTKPATPERLAPPAPPVPRQTRKPPRPARARGAPAQRRRARVHAARATPVARSGVRGSARARRAAPLPPRAISTPGGRTEGGCMHGRACERACGWVRG